MKEKSYLANLFLVLILGVLLAVYADLQVLRPTAILPAGDIPMLVGICLGALVLDHYFAPGFRRDLLLSTLLAAVSFALLPLCVGYVSGLEALLYAAAGGIVFLITTILFDSMVRRFASGRSTKASPAIGAFVLFLACQCFTNIFF